jgi:hypothetical protein
MLSYSRKESLQACHAATAAVHLFYTGKIFGTLWYQISVADPGCYSDPSYYILDPGSWIADPTTKKRRKKFDVLPFL